MKAFERNLAETLWKGEEDNAHQIQELLAPLMEKSMKRSATKHGVHAMTKQDGRKGSRVSFSVNVDAVLPSSQAQEVSGVIGVARYDVIVPNEVCKNLWTECNIEEARRAENTLQRANLDFFDLRENSRRIAPKSRPQKEHKKTGKNARYLCCTYVCVCVCVCVCLSVRLCVCVPVGRLAGAWHVCRSFCSKCKICMYVV